MFDGLDDEIAYNEEEDDITAGKANASRFLNDLKNRSKRNNTQGDGASSDDKSENQSNDFMLNANSDQSDEPFPQRSNYTFDIVDFERQYPSKNLEKKPVPASALPDEEEDRILRNKRFKESLLASLPDRVKDFKVKKEEEEKEPAKPKGSVFFGLSPDISNDASPAQGTFSIIGGK
jgi:hypothetical protein